MFPEFMWDYIRSLDIDQLNELGKWFYDVSGGTEEFDNWMKAEGYSFNEETLRFYKES